MKPFDFQKLPKQTYSCIQIQNKRFGPQHLSNAYTQPSSGGIFAYKINDYIYIYTHILTVKLCMNFFGIDICFALQFTQDEEKLSTHNLGTNSFAKQEGQSYCSSKKGRSKFSSHDAEKIHYHKLKRELSFPLFCFFQSIYIVL